MPRWALPFLLAQKKKAKKGPKLPPTAGTAGCLWLCMALYAQRKEVPHRGMSGLTDKTIFDWSFVTPKSIAIGIVFIFRYFQR